MKSQIEDASGSQKPFPVWLRTLSCTAFFRLARTGHALITKWFVRLGTELDGSPLNQLMFFVGIAGTVFGFISGWNHVTAFMYKSWPALAVAALVAVIVVWCTRHFARSKILRQEDEILQCAAEAITKALRSGTRLTRAEAIGFLRDRVGTEAERVLRTLEEMGVLEPSFDDCVRERKSGNE